MCGHSSAGSSARPTPTWSTSTCADFGAARTPGIFHLFCVCCVVLTARTAQVLTLPMAVYVDGNCLMGPCRGRVDAEMHSFQAWALDVVA